MGQPARTSESHPIRVDWIDARAVPPRAGWTGRLGMTFLPGKRYPGWSGNLHERDLAMDLDRLRSHWAVDAFLLLIQDHEIEMTSTSGIAAAMAERGIDLVRFPIVDMGVSDDLEGLRATLDAIGARLRAGESVVVACLGGLGRTGTVVGCLLVDAGLAASEAVDLVRRTRTGTIQTPAQERFVREWTRRDPTARDAAARPRPGGT